MKITKITPTLVANLAQFIHENQGPTPLSSIRKIRCEINSPHAESQIWIAHTRNRITGYIWIIEGRKGTRGAYYQKPMYTSINQIYVIPSARRRKIGTNLLDTAHTYSLQEAGPIIHADILSENYIAQQFFHHHQYEIIQQWKWQGKHMLRFKKILR